MRGKLIMLHRPYIRKEVREQVEAKAEKNVQGQFLDANTKQPIEGRYDLGHKREHEFWHEKQTAEEEGLTQSEFNDKMNNPDFYQIEDPHENRSHSHEKSREEYEAEEQQSQESEESGEEAGEESGESQGQSM